jgi:hypothetical protein
VTQSYGITYRHTLADLITLDGGVAPQPSVFKAGWVSIHRSCFVSDARCYCGSL